MVIHWPANGYQSLPGTSCSHVKSPWFCCHHPGNASLDHLVNRTCIHRYNRTVANILLNQISLQGSVRREQTEMAIFQPFPQRDLLAYFKSCCLRLWPPGWTSKDIKPVYPRGQWTLNILWKDWCWNWNSNILATWCEELTHWKRPWCWKKKLRARGEGANRGWDGWMASLTQWTWVWSNSGR